MSPAVSETRLDALFREAETSFGRGDFAAAYDAYTELLRARLDERCERPSLWTVGDLVIFERLADLCVLFGRVDAADELLAAMAALNGKADNLYGADYATVKRIHVFLGCGRLREAFAHLEAMVPEIGEIELTPKGLERWEAGRRWPNTDRADRDVLFSTLYLVMGGILAANGQYADALAVFQRGLAHTGESAPPLARQAAVPLHLATAGALLEKGDLDQAGRRLDELRSQIDDVREPGFFVRWLERSGQLSQLRGDLGDAVGYFEQVIDLCRRGSFHHAVRTASLNLAHVLILLNSTCEAEDLLVAVQKEAEDDGDVATTVRASFLFALAAARRGSLADVMPVAPAVKDMLRRRNDAPPGDTPMIGGNPRELPQSANYLSFFDDRALAFHWYLGEKRFDVADDLLREFGETFRYTDSQLIALRLGVLRGLLAYYRQDEETARRELRAAADGLRGLGLKPELWQVLRFLKSDGEDDPAREADELLAEMTGSLSGARRATFLLNKWTANEERLAREIADLGERKAAATRSPWYLRPFRRWGVMRRLDAFLARLESYRRTLTLRADGKDTPVPEPESPPWLLRRLLAHPWRRATISFLVLPDRVLIVRAAWLKLDFGVSPLTRGQLRYLVRRWHEAVKWSGHARDLAPDDLDQAARTTGTKWREISEKLAEALFLPPILERLPRRIRALTFVADDILHGFPFAALVYQGRYLAEQRWALTVDHGLDPEAKPAEVCRDALLVGVARGTDSIPPLPGTHRELDRLELLLASRAEVRVLRDDDATRAAVLAGLRRVAIGHVACHGKFWPDRPDQSGLVLVPETGKTELISLRDLVDAELHGLRHVTLSACWSADNFILPGRWILSLPEALRRAGAGSVLASLWPVDDEVAVAFMAKFYELLASHPRDEALQLARRACLDRTLGDFDVDISAPYFWAGFNLYGDPGLLSWERAR